MPASAIPLSASTMRAGPGVTSMIYPIQFSRTPVVKPICAPFITATSWTSEDSERQSAISRRYGVTFQ